MSEIQLAPKIANELADALIFSNGSIGSFIKMINSFCEDNAEEYAAFLEQEAINERHTKNSL